MSLSERICTFSSAVSSRQPLLEIKYVHVSLFMKNMGRAVHAEFQDITQMSKKICHCRS
jgi:hypothetical protein